MEHNPSNRWKEIRKTTPSGKTMFVCLSCGDVTPAPTPECSELVVVDYMQSKVRMPCSAWPMSPDKYLVKKLLEANKEAYFSGVVFLPEGTYEVSALVPLSIGREVAVRAVESNYGTKPKVRQRKETREMVLDEVMVKESPIELLVKKFREA